MSGSFLQSAEWERLQIQAGRKTWRVGGTLLIRHDLPLRFNYIYCPRPQDFSFLEEAEKIGRKEGSIFLKIDPREEPDIAKIKNPKFAPSASLQPQKTLLMDLQKSEDELLRQMHEKTRYNIRLAERTGVEITQEGDFETFWSQLQKTAERDKFSSHERIYYQKLIQERSIDFSNELFFAKYKSEVLASALINFYTPAKTAVYLHGASVREHREVMAPHLLHWKIILEARRRGLSLYDLGGIDEEKWPGVTRFKKGFGGRHFAYPATMDIIYSPTLYLLYNTARNLRKK